MKHLGLIGYPIDHSHSPRLFNEELLRELDAHYDLYPLKRIEEFPRLVIEYPELIGLNVTAPHKVSVLQYVHDLSPEADAIGATNCLVIDRQGENYTITAHNTDVYGFDHSLRGEWDRLKHALILGTGGAGRSVAYALQRRQIPYHYVSRMPERGQIGYEEIEGMLCPNMLIVNATPVGLDNEDEPQVPYRLLDETMLCYDLNYIPSETRFMRLASIGGARVLNGSTMLRLQAEGSLELWREHLLS